MPKSHFSRRRSGVRTGGVSLAVNFGLFLLKFGAGILADSIAVVADAFNSLTDCFSGVATSLGFHLKPSRRHHPEKIAGVIISIIIFATAISTAHFALVRICAPEPVLVEPVAVLILVAAITIKLALAVYVHRKNRSVKSATLTAVAWDAFSDVLASLVALSSLLISPESAVPLDGYLGLVVAVIIAVSGVRALRLNLKK
jgi:cation diffusion facilitator family transporter